MHSFLEAIGFEQMNNTQLDKILDQVVEKPNYMNLAVDSQKNEFVEYAKDFGESVGICVCGTYLEDGNFCMDYYYPYFRGKGITSEDRIEIQKHAEKESYAGICDDVKVGVNLIFYIQNTADYLVVKSKNKTDVLPKMNVTLSGLALTGKILLPIIKNEDQEKQSDKMIQERNHLIAAARDGDEEAIENLTLEDIDMYSMISKRIITEDVLSIVDTSFMPFGIESDQYSVLGEILDISVTENSTTRQKIFLLTIDTNNLIYDVCICEKDLLGEPTVGRRFRGNIWMQGTVTYEV